MHLLLHGLRDHESREFDSENKSSRSKFSSHRHKALQASNIVITYWSYKPRWIPECLDLISNAFYNSLCLVERASTKKWASLKPIGLSQRFRMVSVYSKWWRWVCVCVIRTDSWSHLVHLDSIGQWPRSFRTYLIVPQMQSCEYLQKVTQMRLSHGGRLLISLDWSWSHRPMIALLQDLHGCSIDPDWRVSTRNDEDKGVWWEWMVDLT